jgi:hypothetical protein
LTVGHGPPWTCPYPKSYENYKKTMERDENKEFSEKQFNRRLENMIKKYREKKTWEIIGKSKKNTNDATK